jgi:hypothetical protein
MELEFLEDVVNIGVATVVFFGVRYVASLF